MTSLRAPAANWTPVLVLATLYLPLHLLLDRLSQFTALPNEVSLWYPAAGLVLAVVLRLRLIGALLGMAGGILSFLLFYTDYFPGAKSAADNLTGIVFAVFSPVCALLVRAVMRRLGYMDPRAIPRPQMAMALIFAGVAFSLMNALLARVLAAATPTAHSFDSAAFLNWWFGDLVGCTAMIIGVTQIVLPVMLGHIRLSFASALTWMPRILLYALLSCLPALLDHLLIAYRGSQIAFLVAIPIFYAALRRGAAETGGAIFIANVGFLLAIRHEIASSPVDLQAFVLVINTGGILAAAITTNQNAMLKALRSTLAERDAANRDRLIMERELADIRRLDALGEMAGGMAHELNNLLHPIKSFARAAAAAPEEKRLHYLSRINECADGAHLIVSDVLAFARSAEAHPDEPETPVDARASLVASLALAAEALPESIALITQIDIEEVQIRCNPARLSQVVVNLVNNARDAMPGGGRITVHGDTVLLAEDDASSLLRPGHYVRLAVEDTGSGMSSETLQRIFEPFFSTKEVGRGTGLGLSVAYGLVRRWHGSITATSTPGTGSRFTVHIPVAQEPGTLAVNH